MILSFPYDIDLFINRTLVYGSLSACVVGLAGHLGHGDEIVDPTGCAQEERR